MVVAMENREVILSRAATIWLALRTLLVRTMPEMTTALEEQLTLRLAEANKQVHELEVENDKLKSMLKVHELEIRLLVGVNERNQVRVEAETAEWAQRVALAMGEKRS